MNIVVISFSNLSNDPRVRRQIKYLCQKNHCVYTIGYRDSDEQVKSHVDVTPRTVSTKKQKIQRVLRYLSRQHLNTYRYYYPFIDNSFFGAVRIDLIIANDFSAMPLAIKLKNNWKGSKILLDAHEYTPRQKEDLWNWRLFEQPYQKYIVKTTIKQADAMLTVAPGIADEYYRVYGVKPQVMVNASKYYEDIVPINVDKDKIKFIYHGFADPSRNLENLIKVFLKLEPDYHLYLMLVGQENYIKKLKKYSQNKENITFVESVKMEEIISNINKYDVGITFYPPINFNIKNALPNKFFESIQARLAILSGPTPAIKKYVEEYGNGIICNDFSIESLIASIKTLTPESVMAFKQASHAAAEEFSEIHSLQIFQSVLDKLFEKEL
jgi:glycosyltransferase involved in cell wall biosynthesis